MTDKKKVVAKAKDSSTEGKKVLLFLTGILLITFIAYTPSLKNGFTNWDDNVYIGENTLIKDISAEGVKDMFSTENHVSLNYHPITILSLAIDYKLSAYKAKTYHTTNLLFHILNTTLVFWFVYLLSGKRLIAASIVSIFFGIHPMHVESVAWISERKDVLYTFFFMGGLIAYYKYCDALGTKKLLLYGLVLLLFLLSLLSKAMAVVLPVVFLLVDYYRGRKIDKLLILEKIPLFVLALLFGMLASSIQSEGAAIAKFDTFTLFQRFAFANYGLVNYIYKLFLPIDLSCFYPYPRLIDDHLPIIYFVCPFIVLAFFAITFISLQKTKDVLFGFLFYCITIALVLQFISVGQVIMAERYTYIPYIGLLFPIAMGADWVFKQTDAKFKKFKTIFTVLMPLLILASATQTFKRTKVWSNSDTLWTDAISKAPQSESPYRNRGSYLVNKKAYDLDAKRVGEIEVDRAFNDFNISIQLNPEVAETYTNRANIYGLRGNFDLALSDYSRSIELDSTNAQTLYNRGVTYSMMKQFDKAIEDYKSALRLDPSLKDALKSIAYSYVDNKNYDKAIEALNDLIVKDPTNAVHYFYRGVAFYNNGNPIDALADNSKAIELNPSYADAYFNRSFINYSLKKYSLALTDALKAKELGYNVAPNYLSLLQNNQ